MIKRLFIITLVLQATSMHGDAGTSARSRAVLNRLTHGKNTGTTIRTHSDEQSDTPKYYPVILEIPDGEDADGVIAELEAVVYHHRGNLYLTSIPTENLDRLPRSGGIDKYEISSRADACLDVSRAVTRIDGVHRRLGIANHGGGVLSKVVTGICDVGFDPRHEAFKNTLKRWVIYDEYNATRTVYDGYDNIVSEGPATDDATETHATHVGNILAGNCTDAPYYGAAPTSDFVATVSRLTDVGICSGIEDIIDYAKSLGKRAVVNISAGSYLGPHDGTDLVGRYLAAMAEEAVIIFSAGNFGTSNICLSLDLDECPELTGWTFCGSSWTGFDVYGGTDLWSRDATPFEFRLVAWDVDDRVFKYVTDWMGGEREPEGEHSLDLEAMPWFSEGGIWASWGTSVANNRFNVALEYGFLTEDVQKAGPWARYKIGFQLRPVKDNTYVDVYADGIQSFLQGRDFGSGKSITPTSDGSISNLACGAGVIAVGSWDSRNIVPDIEKGESDWGNGVNCVTSWSAYGSTVDGRSLPHFCAPGNTVVSALSSVTTEQNDVAYIHNDFKYTAMRGTSMSSPLAAGVYALWLEADPDLTRAQLTEIAVKTANRNFSDIDDPRWGAGALDAYAGLDEVIHRLSVSDITVDGYDAQPYARWTDAHTLAVTWPGVDSFSTEIFDLTGRQLLNGSLTRGHGPLLIRLTDRVSGKTRTLRVL